MKTLTLNEIIGFNPCDEYTENDNALLLQLANGRTECTLIELLEREDIPPEDRVWLATQDGVLAREQAVRFAAVVAKRAGAAARAADAAAAARAADAAAWAARAAAAAAEWDAAWAADAAARAAKAATVERALQVEDLIAILNSDN